jgi:hypothetical protein
MTMKRLMAGAAAAALGAVGLVVATSAPASATTCKWHWDHKKEVPEWCKPKPTKPPVTKPSTTTSKPAGTTSTTKAAPTTTVVVKPEVVKPKPPAAVKATPKFTG